MLRYNSQAIDKSIQYGYNGIGNIESVTYYSGNSSTPYKTETYGYSGDRLTSYNGESISYNSNGCPTTYNGYATTWQNGKLTRFRMGMKLSGMHDYTYSYNGLGQRIKRSYKYTEGSLVGGSNDVYWGMPTGSDITMSYDHSGRLISESIEKTYYGENGSRNEDVVYLYDENSVIGMVYTNSDGTNTYYFQRNLLGDIIGIYDTNGNKVGGYAYDAWGNCEFASDTTNYDVVYANSFRYRGYYYDTDTKLYYLNARYYSPEWRRFISPDETDYIDPESVNGLNLYCYCGNDPINRVDPSGYAWDWNTFLHGLGMVFTAVGAIALSATTFGAGIPLAMSVVAGITLGAGILTGVNGIATVVEVGTDYNFVRDGLFNSVLGLSDSAYNIYSGITAGVALLGSAVLGFYHTTGQYKAAKYGQKYLKPGYTKAGYTKAGTPRYVSKDGLRQMRFDKPHMYKGKMIGKHLNLEFFEGTKPLAYEHVLYDLFNYWIL